MPEDPKMFHSGKCDYVSFTFWENQEPSTSPSFVPVTLIIFNKPLVFCEKKSYFNSTIPWFLKNIFILIYK